MASDQLTRRDVGKKGPGYYRAADASICERFIGQLMPRPVRGLFGSVCIVLREVYRAANASICERSKGQLMPHPVRGL